MDRFRALANVTRHDVRLVSRRGDVYKSFLEAVRGDPGVGVRVTGQGSEDDKMDLCLCQLATGIIYYLDIGSKCSATGMEFGTTELFGESLELVV